MNGDALRGDTGPVVYGPPAPRDLSPVRPMTVTQTDAFTVQAREISADARTQYDLQANGNTRYIYQSPTNPNYLHAIFMVSTDPGPGYDNRNARYFISTNGGTNWEYIGVVFTTRSGFPSLTVTNDNRAVVLAHNTEINSVQTTHLAVDLAPGVGSWTMLNPGITNPALGNIWPEVAIDLSNNKVLFAASQNGVDSAKVNVCTNLNSPGTFVGWKTIPNGETAEQYSVAVGTGKYGVAFNTLSGGAALIESTDQGVTWGAPQTIWNWNPADSMGTLRSIDLRYEGSTPQVALGLLHVDPVGGTFSPGLPSKMVFWSPGVNGGNPVTIDSGDGLNGSNSTNDVFVSVTRGVISKNGAGALMVAYNKSRQDTSSIGNNYFDVYLAYSVNGGASWTTQQVTNLPGQYPGGALQDCRYPALSPSNDGNNAYIVCQTDSVPASNVNGAPASNAKFYFYKLTNVIGINTISSQVPASYNLEQNYPNPFNPVTKIRFAVPTAGLVTLRVYDILGKEVSMLVNQNLTAGTFEYEFNASSLPSGVYFYRLESGNFVDTKKLVLVK